MPSFCHPLFNPRTKTEYARAILVRLCQLENDTFSEIFKTYFLNFQTWSLKVPQIYAWTKHRFFYFLGEGWVLWVSWDLFLSQQLPREVREKSFVTTSLSMRHFSASLLQPRYRGGKDGFFHIKSQSWRFSRIILFYII